MSYEEIEEAFYHDEYYIQLNQNLGIDFGQEIIVPSFHVGAKKRKVSSFKMPLLRKSLNSLVSSGFLSRIFTKETSIFELAMDFADFAYELYRGDFDLFSEKKEDRKISDGIPAADRFVSLTDNQNEVAQAVTALGELSDAIRNTNDPLTANPEDRLLLSKEVDLLKDLISQPRIQVVALYNAIYRNSTVKWLAEQIISGVVQQAAISSYEHLSALWQSVSNLI